MLLLNSNAPLHEKQRKFQQKPLITRGIQNSIYKKNRLFKKYIKCNNQDNKNTLHNEHQAYRNKLSTLMKQSKKTLLKNLNL